MKHSEFKIISDETVFQGFFSVKKFTLTHRLFSGQMSDQFCREIFVRRPVAAVLPYDPDRKKVILIEQFRVGAIESENPWLLELIAGIIEPNESAEDMAKRESQEEAGLELFNLQKIYQYYTSPGGTNEQLTLFCAHVDSKNAGGIWGAKEEHEDIKVHVLSTDKAFQLLEEGKITNAATIIALQWLQKHIAENNE